MVVRIQTDGDEEELFDAVGVEFGNACGGRDEAIILAVCCIFDDQPRRRRRRRRRSIFQIFVLTIFERDGSCSVVSIASSIVII